MRELRFAYFFVCVEWTLYEQVAVAAMDCQNIDVAKVNSTTLNSLPKITSEKHNFFRKMQSYCLYHCTTVNIGEASYAIKLSNL